MDQKLRDWSKPLTGLLHFIVFIFSVYPYSDYDWGWHYRYGEYFFKSGSILRKDIFSWTLPGYYWINHSWLYDLILYVLYTYGGFLLLMIIGGAIGFLTYYLSIKPFKLNLWQKVVIAFFYLNFMTLILMQSLRSQVLILPLYPILMLVLMKSKEKIKTLYFLPLIFLLWVNLHGTFTIGILITLVFLITRFILDFRNEKQNFKTYFLSLFFTFIATLINPFFFQPYLEAVRHLSSPWLKNVFEWIPFFQYASAGMFTKSYFVIFVLLFLTAFIYRKKVTDIPYVIILSILVYLTIGATRYIGPLTVVALPIAASILQDVHVDMEKFKSFYLIALLILVVTFEIGINRIVSVHLLNYSFTDYCDNSSGCSEKLAQYLLKNPPLGQGYNFYDWGGFLIGRGIKTKLFIDGRMHLWQGKTYMPFADNYEIYYKKNYELFQKYGFDWVLVRNDSNLARDLLGINNSLGAWKRQFYDDQASYFVKIK